MYFIVKAYTDNTYLVLDTSDNICERVSIDVIKDAKSKGIKIKSNTYLEFLDTLYIKLVKLSLMSDIANIKLVMVKSLQNYKYALPKFEYSTGNLMSLYLDYIFINDVFFIQTQDIVNGENYLSAITNFGIFPLVFYETQYSNLDISIPSITFEGGIYYITYRCKSDITSCVTFKFDSKLQFIDKFNSVVNCKKPKERISVERIVV